MNKIREVWYVDQYVGHPKYGNVYRNFFLAKELQKKGLKLRVFSGSYSHLMYNSPNTDSCMQKEVLDGVEFYWVKTKKYKGGQSLGRIFAIFEYTLRLWSLRKFSPPDVVITPSLSMIPIWMIFMLNKFVWKNNAKIIFEVRDIWPLTLTTLGKKSPNHPFVKLLAFTERIAYEKSDHIISTLKMCDEHIRSVTKKNFKFSWVDNGINVNQDYITAPEEVKSLIPKDKFLIGYTGSLGLANAMHYLVEAARTLQEQIEFHFLIIGDGTERERLEEQAKGLNNITFIGKIKKDFVQDILSMCDVLYLSYANVPELYKYGVSANKTYEYMLSCKPVIVSSPPMRYNIISEAKCGEVIPAEDSEAIVLAVKKLYEFSTARREEMGVRGKDYIMKNNTFPRLAEKLYDVITD